MKVIETVLEHQRLQDMDEACTYAAASSYNFLNAELGRLRSVIVSGGVVRVEDEAGSFVIGSVAEFLAWARGQYPHATPV